MLPSVEFQPRLRDGLIEFPVHHVRGGTSTGLVLWEPFAPREPELREELLRHLMGVPLSGTHPGNRQITGLGRGAPTSNKVFFADWETHAGAGRLVSTLAQLAGDHAAIDWSVNCGNLSSALPLWALDVGLVSVAAGETADISIRNSNTGVISTGRIGRGADGALVRASIPGVDGEFPSVDLFLHHPVGAKTGQLLPTGQVVDLIDGRAVSCVDVAVPMVIALASDFGKTAHESLAELQSDHAFMSQLRDVWVAAGLRMGLRRRDGELMSADELARSETQPKVCIVGPPKGDGNIAVRYFTPQSLHASMAVSGGCCLAAAALIPGSVAWQVAKGLDAPSGEFADIEVAIENPAGILTTTVVARECEGRLEVDSAAYRRTAQVLLRGHVPLYRASPQLIAALRP
ncbi:PrpF protein [Pseudomonas seleniipraecipitans]|uniref:PrpF protein n=1 Tax=Phytopseudomonas seleniipraecipitans TaxID=640205 RepID=A0ABY5JCX3_9GAMM|nr:PrpF domain-containing protein [Pseudomonas seleniipraecipitans]UUD64707.1 PrpF protein [Pseudomonas seleniipraecipitans]